MSAIHSMFNYLSNGNQVTSRQARTLFKIENVADVVYRLRNEGVAVYTNKVKLSDGTRTYAYRIGNPSEAFAKYFERSHYARARKALYRNAISVKMAA
jgi:LEA14-like dessication related protein